MPALPVALAHAVHDATRRLGGSPLLWSDLLRPIPDEGIPLADLPAAARISRRAVKSWVGVDNGLVRVADKHVTLTDQGRSERDTWAERVAAVDSPPLRRALADLVGRFDLEFCWYPMTYGTADPSVAGGRARPAQVGPPRIPPHGTDWVPVARTDPSAAQSLPLSALASQALMAFSIDYEELLGFPMRWAAVLLRSLGAGPMAVGAVPAELGVTGSGKSTLERHGVVRVTGGKAGLTAVGERIVQSHERAVARVVEMWSDRYGVSVVDAVERALRRVPVGADEVHVRWVVGTGFTGVS